MNFVATHMNGKHGSIESVGPDFQCIFYLVAFATKSQSAVKQLNSSYQFLIGKRSHQKIEELFVVASLYIAYCVGHDHCKEWNAGAEAVVRYFDFLNRRGLLAEA